jgi:hypothetical protein
MATHTASYWFIEIALEAHAKSFSALEARMDAFEPLPMEAFHDEWQRMWDQMRPINKGMSDEDLKRFIDSQFALGKSKQMQYMNAFLKPFTAEMIAITVLSHALVETTINALLALGLENSQKEQLFHMLEKAEVKKKWIFGPQAFLPDYILPKSIALHESLSILCRRRNAYAHSKITLRDGSDQVLLPGSAPHSISINEDSRKLMHRFLTLPYDLHRHLLYQIADKSLRFKLAHILRHEPAEYAHIYNFELQN